MILEELSADEPFRLALPLGRRLTVVVGLGPERRSWLASALSDAVAGRPTTLWGVVEILRMRVDLGDPLVVRGAAFVDLVIGPGLWRAGMPGEGGGTDELWPSSSLPERPGEAAAETVADAPAPAEPRLSPDAGPAPRQPRRWRRAAGPDAQARRGPLSDEPMRRDDAAVDPQSAQGGGARGGGPAAVPPPVDLPDPPPPPILVEAGPPVPERPATPPRPVVVGRLPDDQLPPAPVRPAALNETGPADPGPRPEPPVLSPAPVPRAHTHPVDERLERRVAQLEQAVAERQAAVTAARAASKAVVVPPAGDTTAVAAALAELERLEADESAAAREARRLSERWAEAEAAVASTATSIVPKWLLDSARNSLEQARRRLAEAEAEAGLGSDLDADLVARLEAAHRRLLELEGERRLASPGHRRRLQAARDDEAGLLRQLGVPSYDALAGWLDRRRRTEGEVVGLEQARAEVAEAQATWAELHAPRNDARAGAASARLAAVWADVVAFLGFDPPDVLAALAAAGAAGPSTEEARAALAAALRESGAEVPSVATELAGAARAWLAGAGARAAAAAAAADAAKRAAEGVRRAQEALATSEARRAEAVSALAAASKAAEARRTAADLAHRQAVEVWRREVEAAQAAHAAADERWREEVARLNRWSQARQEAESAHERAMAEHGRRVAALREQHQATLAATQQEADEAWAATVAALRAEHERRQAERAAWERGRAEAQAAWEAAVAEVASERRRLEAQRAEAMAALAKWEERHRPAPSLPELEALLAERLAANHTDGVAGTIPVVVDDALSSLPEETAAALFEAFVEASAAVQVVYLTDDHATLALAANRQGISIVQVEPGA